MGIKKTLNLIDIKNRREFYKISGMFLLGLAAYGTIIAFFTSTVYVTADEELYVALAKSFHYTGSFEVNGKMANYNCVLYSISIHRKAFYFLCVLLALYACALQYFPFGCWPGGY